MRSYDFFVYGPSDCLMEFQLQRTFARIDLVGNFVYLQRFVAAIAIVLFLPEQPLKSARPAPVAAEPEPLFPEMSDGAELESAG